MSDPVTTMVRSRDLPNGAEVIGYKKDGSLFWIFKNKGVTTRIRLSPDAVMAMGEIASELDNPDNESA